MKIQGAKLQQKNKSKQVTKTEQKNIKKITKVKLTF
jgi:hypothetical protein